VNNVSRWIETWKTVNGSWLCVEERVISFQDRPAMFTRWSWEGPATSGKRKALALLPQDKAAAIKAYREETGASLAEAKAAVEAMAREHGLAVSSPSLLNSATTWGVVLCLVGIGACFLPAVTVHVYNVIEPGQASGNQRWTSLPDPGLFSWEWTTITATFLALGLYLIGTHAVRRLAVQRASAMILAGVVVLVVDVLRAQVNLRVVGRVYNTPHVGFYAVGVVAVALLVLGVITLRDALVNAKVGADAGRPMNPLGRKLRSLWGSALSLCVGSRVKGPSHAPLSGSTHEGEEPVGQDTNLPVMMPEAPAAGGPPIMPRSPTSTKVGSRGCLPWLLVVAFAFTVASIMAVLTMPQMWSISDEAAATAGASPGDEAKKDVERIQGTWAVISLEEDGKQAPRKVVVAMAFTGDRVKVIREGDEQEGSFRLVPTQNPKAIDLLIGGLGTPGIYTLEGDRLTICFNLDEHGKRPKRFATDAKTYGLRLMTLKRQ
jgi:uncharacterized protein (TIGR03067 family)